MREWPFQNRFARAGRLANDHDIAHDRAAGDWCRLHAPTTAALNQLSNELFELDLFNRRCHQRRKIEKIDNNKLSTMLRMMQVTMGK